MHIKNKNLYNQLKKTTEIVLKYIENNNYYPSVHELCGLKDFTDFHYEILIEIRMMILQLKAIFSQ